MAFANETWTLPALGRMLTATHYADAVPAKVIQVAVSPDSYEWTYGETPFSHLSWPVMFVAVYLCTIFGLQSWMEGREKMDLGSFPKWHNLLLATWSAAMCFGTLYEIFNLYKTDDRYNSISDLFCDETGQLMKGRVGYWAWVYYASKFYELLDTVLMVLKKRPLTFLHVYHHIVIISLCWTWNQGNYSQQWWAVVVNTAVHIVMYSYYYLRIVNPGKDYWWKAHITQFQLLQFLSVFINIFVWFYISMTGIKFTDTGLTYESSRCSGDVPVVVYAQTINTSFLFLFGNFYVQTYLSKQKAKADKAKAKKEEGKAVTDGVANGVANGSSKANGKAHKSRSKSPVSGRTRQRKQPKQNGHH